MKTFAAMAALVLIAAAPAPVLTQQAVIEVVTRFAALYDGAANGLAQGRVRRDRARALCGEATVKAAQGMVKDWHGTVRALSSVADGRGILRVDVGGKVTLATHSLALTDEEHTLIPIDSPVYRAAEALREGDRVVFSGQFFPSAEDCMKETSLTVSGGMEAPEFLFRFSALAPER